MHLLLLLGCTAPDDKPEDPLDTACADLVSGYVDADGDGFGDPAAPVEVCAGTSGVVADATDCDDRAAAVFPGASEVWYDGADEDCAGGSDYDQDGDGYDRDAECDDTDPARYPDPEVVELWYDGIDQNCDGNDGDQDGDGYYIAEYAHDVPAAFRTGDCWDDPAATTGWAPLNGLAALDAADVHPDATDAPYDGLDADCAGGDDFDQDGDGAASDAWPDASGAVGDDCADEDPAVHPGAADAWYDGVDSDCAENDDYDQDGDGFPAEGGTGDIDCDDTTPDVFPGAQEACGDGVDANCDGSTFDADAKGCTEHFADLDGDGYGAGDSACLCEPAGTYTTLDNTDCDDADPERAPGLPELCDGIDNACIRDWSTASEAGVVSEVAADGTWTDLTATFATGRASDPVEWSLGEGTTLEFCPATWFVHLDLPDTVSDATVEGPYGAAATFLDGAHSGQVLAGGDGPGLTLALRGVTIQSGEADYGGGVAISGGGVTITDVVFDTNSAQIEGGGLYLLGGAAHISGTTFRNNNALSSGGGMSGESASLTLTGCTFEANNAGPDTYASGGGLTYISYADETLTLESCAFHANGATADTSGAFGGAMYVSRSSTGETFVSDTTFVENVAVSLGTSEGSASGGALYLSLGGSGDAALERVYFTDNVATGPASGFAGGAAVWQTAANTVQWDASIWTGNTSAGSLALGGAMVYSGSAGADMTLTACNMGDNAVRDGAGTVAGYGGAVYLSMADAAVTLDGTVVRSNLASSAGGVEVGMSAGSSLLMQNHSVLDGNLGSGLAFVSGDPASTVDLVDSQVTGNSGSGVSMSTSGTGAVAALSCTGSRGNAAGFYGNAAYGVSAECGGDATCTVEGDLCDFTASGLSNAYGALSAYATVWLYGEDASFSCDGTSCR